MGAPRAGRDRSVARVCVSCATRCRTARRTRSRACRTRAVSSATSGTTSLAASVGVAARTSATRSRMGESGSCPIALTSGVRTAATTRTRPSSLNGSRSSTDPPPRATTITSTSGSSSRRRSASITWRAAPVPWTRVCSTRNCTPGQRRRATSRTSRSAAESLPVTSPTQRGQERQRPLALGPEQPLGREQPPPLLQPGQQLAEPDRADLVDVEAQRAAAVVPAGPGVHDHLRALGDRGGERVEQPPRARRRHGHVHVGVAQHEPDPVLADA